ncbi:TIP-1 family-domain-containing protein [Usnea florida]
MAEVAYRTNASRIADEEQDVRVEDFLNDKLQNTTDLANINSLLEDVKAQQVLLQQQIKLDKDTEAYVTHSNHLHASATQFKSQQKDVGRRLMIVTQSETSDDAIQKFDSSMESLRKLDVAQAYMELLIEVENLSTEARRNFKKSPQDALQPYLRLQNLVNALKDAQPAAEDAAPHLIDHVDRTTRTLWKQMKYAFAGEFEATLKKMHWPRNDITLDGQLEQEWTNGVKNLLELQEPELKARDSQATESSKGDEPLVLLPLEVMAKPLELRFKYHFEGDRPTNKLAKPEYFLSHLISLLNTYDEFFAVYLQPILREYFRRSNLALTSMYIDSTSALITALLPMLRRKILTLMPQISQQPQLLSHLIHELMNFDVSLRDEWNYDGGNAIDGWKGLTWEVLVKSDWFGRWLEVEKNFALSRYQNIINAPESGEIDYDSVDPGATKPTFAAVRVNDLLETITDRYRQLTSFPQKLRFLIDIQITIFDRFHSRFHDSLEAYLARTSSIARTVQGVSREAQADLQGLGGLERLCRIYGSAEFLEKKMRDWSDDVFFLDLWAELQDRARQSTGENLAGTMSVEDVAERTSSTVGSEEDTGALFDETAGAYRRLRIRTESVIQDMLTHSLRETLRPYGRINPWSSLSEGSSSSLSLTAELDATVQQINDYLSFLSKVLAQVPLRRILRQVALALQSFLWDHVLMRYNFSTNGIAQFQRDIEIIWETMDRWLGEGQGEIGMLRLKESLVLLGLPVKSEESEENRDEDVGLGLWEVEKRVFRSNESGREVLDELGLEMLSESEARHVLERRIELDH